MQISSATSIVISLSIVVCGLTDGNVSAKATAPAPAAAAVQFSGRETNPSNSDLKSSAAQSQTWRRHSRATGADSRASKDYVDGNANAKADTNANTNASSFGSENVLPNALIRKIVTILGKRPANAGIPTPSSAAPVSSADPNKQLFGGRLPPFIERIVQRIQNYFSVYNPPEYFDNNRPPPSSATQQAGITLICSNSAEVGGNGSESVSCNEMNSAEQSEEQPEQEEEQGETLEMCDGGAGAGAVGSGSETAESQDEYNVVVTHTIVQDSSLNVFQPPQQFATAGDSTQMVSNVVVILEPAAGQYSPPPLDNPDKNKFYVYVNPTSGNKNQQQQQQQQHQYDHRLKTWNESVEDDDRESESDRDTAATDKAENSRPYQNTTYTVIIRGDKLQEYNDASNNSSGRPEIAIYIRNSTKKLKKCKSPSSTSSASATTTASQAADSETEDCEQNANAPLTSRSVNLSQPANQQEDDEAKTKAKATGNTNDKQNANKVPNINLMLVPPTPAKNRSCASKNKINKNPQLEYYVLKPDNGNAANAKPTKPRDKEKPTAAKYYLQKTSIDAAALSQTYLPPPLSSPSSPSSPSPLSDGQQQKQQQNDKSTSSVDLL